MDAVCGGDIMYGLCKFKELEIVDSEETVY